MKTNIHFLSYHAPFFLELEMVQTKVVEKIRTRIRILRSVNVFFENHALCEIKWKNIVERDRPQMTVWSMRISCWIPKATETQSEYIILIAFPLQQWLQEHASMLRYTYSDCHLNYGF